MKTEGSILLFLCSIGLVSKQSLMIGTDLSDHLSQIEEVFGLHDGHALSFITQNDQRITGTDVKNLPGFGRDDDLSLVTDRYHTKDVLASGRYAKAHVFAAVMVGQIIQSYPQSVGK